MAKTLIDDQWIREIYKNNQKEYTFCGALEYRYKHIAKNWNAETRKKHEREYNSIILPALRDHNNKTIREYSKEDFEEAIEQIKDKGYVQEGIRHQYSESSIKNFENLIYYVVYQSSVYGLCNDVLWGTKFVLDIADEKEEIEARVFLKKSLSVQQEKNFRNEVLSDVDEDGAVVALLLMWGLGVRNAEACGLNYGDIKPLEGHPECYVAWIYKSTKIDSNKLQSGGKTYNTGRIIPVPEKIVEFLKLRKERILKIITAQGEEVIDVDGLPICCDGWIDVDNKNYARRCTADSVTVAAHDIFGRSGITSKQLAYLDVELSEGDTASLLKEKDPTAYLLRRNFATQMCILGLSNSEMQYLIGHCVEDAYESRNEYVDDDRIYSMYLKLNQRELLNASDIEYGKTEICIHGNETVNIHISAIESMDRINISINGNAKSSMIRTKWFEEERASSYDRAVNILDSYHKLYNY
ncbi:MAG: hypothetical protein K6E63_06465 [Lachnospiraceae bacterium]|nr:hypothetical protein [Lachnospiraceae bacterium]